MKHTCLFLLMVCLIGGFVLLSGCTTYPGTPNATSTLTPVPTTIGDPRFTAMTDLATTMITVLH